jgi:carboxyl-terminal processing protease
MLALADGGELLIRPDARTTPADSVPSGFTGLSLASRDGLVVAAPEPNGPAERAGIEAGDRVLRIGDQNTEAMTVDAAVAMLPGAPGSEVRLTVRRGQAEPFHVVLTREDFDTAPVLSLELGPGLRYVRLMNFRQEAARKLQEALADIAKLAETSVILDLRNNSGGVLSEAIRVSELFLPKGRLVATVEERRRKERYVAENDGPQRASPLVVLVNRSSAGASEIVAAALRHWRGARIVGTATAGKATVQTFTALGGVGFNLTTARFLTADGRSIEGKGIAPDVVIEPPTASPGALVRFGDLETDVLLLRALEVLKLGPPEAGR